MKHTLLTLLLLLILYASPHRDAPVQSRGGAEEARDAFLVTRVKVPAGGAGKTEGPARPKRRPPACRACRLGLGYTLYQRGPAGDPVRVEPSREFHQGDGVRLLLESNLDGYLYVFHTENDGPPRMIYPDARLNDGGNQVVAHVPYEVPSSREADPRFRWFQFDDRAATERLYLVVSRKPLAGVPTGRALVASCRAKANGCPWRPDGEVWGRLVSLAGADTQEGQGGGLGQVLSAVEREAVERGLGLSLNAPAPAIMKISKSPQAGGLMAVVALIHK